MEKEQDQTEPGPRPEADDATSSDAGLPGGTGATPGEGTSDPTGADDDQSEDG